MSPLEAGVPALVTLALLVGASIGYAVSGLRQSVSRQRGWEHLAYVAQRRAVVAEDVVDAFGRR